MRHPVGGNQTACIRMLHLACWPVPHSAESPLAGDPFLFGAGLVWTCGDLLSTIRKVQPRRELAGAAVGCRRREEALSDLHQLANSRRGAQVAAGGAMHAYADATGPCVALMLRALHGLDAQRAADHISGGPPGLPHPTPPCWISR